MIDKIKLCEFEDKFEKKVKEFLLEICVNEFGFSSWKEELESQNINSYKENGGNFWVAMDDEEEIIGTIALKNLGEKKGLLKSMYVNNKYRGSKLAQKLLNILISEAINNNYNIIELETLLQLERAIGFYKKNDFYLKHQDGDVMVFEKKLVV